MVDIFLVEDELDLQLLYQRVLKSSGFQVIATAENGEEAIKKYKSFPTKPDLILMDIIYP